MNGAIDFADVLARVAQLPPLRRLGWRTLDAAELGLNAGEIGIVAGRPGHGKTTVLMNALINWLETHQSDTFVLISHEVPVDAVVVKLLSILTRRHGSAGWSYNDLRRFLRNGAVGAPAGLDPADAKMAIARLRDVGSRLRVVYEPAWTVEDIDRYLKSVAGGAKVGGVFVDYLQLVSGPRELSYESRDHEISTVAKYLKRSAVDIGAPMMVAAQIMRSTAALTEHIIGVSLEDERVLREIGKRRPQLHHVGEGGGDQEADLVLGILNYRAELVASAEESGISIDQSVTSGDASPFEIVVLKNRYGRLLTAPLVIELRSGYIRDPGVFGK